MNPRNDRTLPFLLCRLTAEGHVHVRLPFCTLMLIFLVMQNTGHLPDTSKGRNKLHTENFVVLSCVIYRGSYM